MRQKIILNWTKKIIQCFKIWGHLEDNHIKECLKTAIEELFIKENEYIQDVSVQLAHKQAIKKLFNYWLKNYFEQNSKYGSLCNWRYFLTFLIYNF